MTLLSTAELEAFSRDPHGISRISWSKNGFVAYSLPNPTSTNLYITYLESINSQQWQLATPMQFAMLPNSPTDPQLLDISLVSWSNVANDLAISDIHGNFHILLSGVTKSESSANFQLTSFNQFETIYKDTPMSTSTSTTSSSASNVVATPANTAPYASTAPIGTSPVSSLHLDDSPHKLVAFKWLNVEKPIITNKPAIRIDQDSTPTALYSYGVNQQHPYGPWHPIASKQACLGLRRNGDVCLWYQGEHGLEYFRVSAQLEPKTATSSTVWISHSSIGFQKDGKIVLVVYCALTKLIKSYSIEINWGHLSKSAELQKENANFSTPTANQIAPTLKVKRISAQTVNEVNQYGELRWLSSIKLVSPNFHPDSELDILITYESLRSGEIMSSIERFRLNDQFKIHDSFVNIGNKGISANTDSSKHLMMVLKEKIERKKPLLSISSVCLDLFISIVYTDGTIDIIDRKTMKVISEKDTQTGELPPIISSMFEAGFRFPSPECAPLFVEMSPNLSAYITIPYNANYGTTTRPKMICAIRPVQEKLSDQDVLAISAAFAYRHSYACYTNTCGDDLMATIQTEITSVHSNISETCANFLTQGILHESHKAINFSLDILTREQVDKLLSNPPLQRLLSLQLTLGNVSVTGKISWALLNLRCTSFAVMFSLSSIYRNLSKRKASNQETLQESQWRAENIFALLGCVRWHLDFMIFLNQELLELCGNSLNQDGNNLTDSGGFGASMQHSVVLPMILGKVPRSLIIYSINSIKKTFEVLKKLITELTDCNKLYPPMKEAYNRFIQVYHNSPINLDTFEKYLADVDTALRSLRTEKAAALPIEQELVCMGTIPKVLQDPARKIVELYAQTVRKDIKTAELYFYDVEWLGLYDSPASQSVHKTATIVINPPIEIQEIANSNGSDIDSLRKSQLADGAPLRRCVRCRSISARYETPVFSEAQSAGLWSMAFQRNCMCGSSWINVDN